jgi:hypothetical protein
MPEEMREHFHDPKAVPLSEHVSDLENRVREKVKELDAELRSRVACEILGPLRDVPPAVWALVVLAERLLQADADVRALGDVDAMAHLIDCEQTLYARLLQAYIHDVAKGLAALGQLQRVRR